MLKERLILIIRYYLPALLWVGLIFYFSSVPELKVVGGTAITSEIILRKLAHIGEFALLAWLLWRVFFVGHRYNDHQSLVFSSLAVILFSISDEIHQSFVIGRAGRAIDVVIDILGAEMGSLAAYSYYTKTMKKLTIIGILIIMIGLTGLVGMMILDARRQAALAPDPMTSEEIGLVEMQGEGSDEDPQVLAESTIRNEAPIVDTQESGDTAPVQDPLSHEPEEVLPKKVKVNVPFTSQAPYANWDEVHEEACEETSLIMVWAFLNKQPLSQEKVEEQIQKLTQYQTKKYGDYHDSDARELVDIAEDFYGIKNLKVVYDFDKEDLKRELAKGKPVILPTAGRQLGNPNFKNPGPLYHNLVAIGYDGANIITNDPGTRKGKDFIYNEDVLFNAIHDFPGKKENIEQGRKAMIVIE